MNNLQPSSDPRELGIIHRLLMDTVTKHEDQTNKLYQQLAIIGQVEPDQEQEFFINMGPQHPSTHGVLRLLLKLKGETVLHVKPICGYIHRGIEKMCEYNTYQQIIHLTDRLDYISAHMNNEAVCLLVEKALEVEVPERVKVIRTLMSELTRLASHALWWSVMGMDLGAVTAFFYGFRDRELVLDIFEKTTGSRLLQSYFCPGGLMADLHPDFQKDVKALIQHFKSKIPEYDQLVTGNIIFQERTKGIGILSLEDAISYGTSGPTARASGQSCDLRKLRPYSAYDRVQFKEIVGKKGDCFERYQVRIAELWESISIIEQLIDNIPEGSIIVKMKAVIKLPEGDYYQGVETARGEFGVYVHSDGQKFPYRMKLRSPNYCNLNALNQMAKGNKIADLVAVMASIDLVIPDVDR